MRDWGQSPQPGLGAETLVRGSAGRSSPEADTLLVFGRSMEAANLLTFLQFRNLKK